MKLKSDIEKACSIMRKKMFEEKKKNNTEEANYYLGFLQALDWVRWNREHGVEDLPL